jgi:hypothetical protein
MELTPKSATQSSASSALLRNNKFSGLRSRCTIPSSWRYLTALVMVLTISAASLRVESNRSANTSHTAKSSACGCSKTGRVLNVPLVIVPLAADPVKELSTGTQIKDQVEVMGGLEVIDETADVRVASGDSFEDGDLVSDLPDEVDSGRLWQDVSQGIVLVGAVWCKWARQGVKRLDGISRYLRRCSQRGRSGTDHMFPPCHQLLVDHLARKVLPGLQRVSQPAEMRLVPCTWSK